MESKQEDGAKAAPAWGGGAASGAAGGAAGDRRLPAHGWLGFFLVAVFWALNWGLEGARTHWGFFPLWLGYCLAVDGLAWRRQGHSLLTRDGRAYAALFAVSAPAWWLFEAFNERTGNWHYVGAESFGPLAYGLLATLSFSTVVPAVFGTAELVATSGWVRRREGRGPRWAPGLPLCAAAGAAMLAAVLLWPRQGYPLVWLSVFFLLDPLNARLGNRSLLAEVARGEWRTVVSLTSGALVCGFFWELWNVYSYPKWIYEVPYFGFWHVFEMPLLGYGGYLPFALELFALHQLAAGCCGRWGRGWRDYVLPDGSAAPAAGGTAPGRRRFFSSDPFGNRIEFIQDGDGFSQRPK